MRVTEPATIRGDDLTFVHRPLPRGATGHVMIGGVAGALDRKPAMPSATAAAALRSE